MEPSTPQEKRWWPGPMATWVTPDADPMFRKNVFLLCSPGKFTTNWWTSRPQTWKLRVNFNDDICCHLKSKSLIYCHIIDLHHISKNILTNHRKVADVLASPVLMRSHAQRNHEPLQPANQSIPGFGIHKYIVHCCTWFDCKEVPDSLHLHSAADKPLTHQ